MLVTKKKCERVEKLESQLLSLYGKLGTPKILSSVISEFYWEKIVEGGFGRGGVEEQSNAKKIEVITDMSIHEKAMQYLKHISPRNSSSPKEKMLLIYVLPTCLENYTEYTVSYA